MVRKWSRQLIMWREEELLIAWCCRCKGMSQGRGLTEDVGNWSGNKMMGKVLAESRRLGIKRPAGGLLWQRHLIFKKV